MKLLIFTCVSLLILSCASLKMTTRVPVQFVEEEESHSYSYYKEVDCEEEEAVMSYYESHEISPSQWQNGIAVFDFSTGGKYTVNTRPGFFTDIILEKGERLNQPASGDTSNWLIDVVVSEQDQQHLLIKPIAFDVKTNIIVPTNKRTYFLFLTSSRHEFMTAVKWQYPKTKCQQAVTVNNDPDDEIDWDEFEANRYCRYQRLYKGDEPFFMPKAVCDSLGKTYIGFQDNIAELPALYIYSYQKNPSLQVVNYRYSNQLNMYILDQVVDEIVLRNGEQEIFIINNRYFYYYGPWWERVMNFLNLKWRN